MMSRFRKLKNYGKKGPGGPGGFITLVITNDGDARGVVAEKLDPFGERGECTGGGVHSPRSAGSEWEWRELAPFF